MAHCFDIHKSDRPCPHAPPEKQKHVLCVIIFEQGKVKVIIHRNKKRWNKGFKQERGKAQKWKFTTL
jgi:hypothetical protein